MQSPEGLKDSPFNRNTVNDTNFRNKVARMEGNYKLG